MRCVLTLSIWLASCGPTEIFDTPTDSHVDSEYALLLDEFINTTALHGLDLSSLSIPHHIIAVSEVPIETAVGLCINYGDYWEIQIYDQLPPLTAKAVLWHELGHCVLDMHHWNTGIGDIMNAYLPLKDKYWSKIWDEALARYLNVDLQRQYGREGEEK